MEPELRFDWPATPDVVDRVLARIDDRPRRRIWPIFAVIAALLVPAGVATAVSDDLQEWLGLRHVDVQVGTPPKVYSWETSLAPVTLDQAARIALIDPVIPPALGTPDEIRAVRPGIVVMTFGDLRLYEVRGELGELIQKVLATGEDVERVPGGAYFSKPHFFLFQRPNGEIIEGRTAKQTLVLERDGLVLRLEGKGLTKAEALRLLQPA